MGNRISFVFLLFIGSIPFSLINYLPAFKENLPDPLHIVTSVIAVLALLLAGLFMGYHDQRYFMRWYTAYWFLGALLMSLGYWMKSFILLIPTVFLYAAPFYGLRSFFNLSADAVLLNALIPTAWLLGMGGYAAGAFLRRKTPSAANP